MKKTRLFVLAIASFVSQLALSAEIRELRVSKDGRHFVAEADFLINAPLEDVLGAFTDFDQLPDLNPAVTASESEVMPDGRIRVRTQVRDCIALFCRSVALVEDVRFDSERRVAAKIIPELSDFAAGRTTWQFYDLGAATRVHYLSQMTPDFWLPPLLGVRAIRRTLGRQIRTTASNLELGE